MEIDLEKIHENASRRELENIQFRSFLKGQDSRKIDRLVHQLNTETSNSIDCTLCANYCRELQTRLDQKDIQNLSKAISKSENEVKEEFLDLEDGDFYLKAKLCTFLNEQKCSIYESRPAECKSYPHLHKPKFIFRLFTVLNNYGICPIVYNVVEELKIATNFRR